MRLNFLKRLDPATWSGPAIVTALACCVLMLFAAQNASNVWLFRTLFFGSLTTAIVVLLRASWFGAREIVIVLTIAVAGVVFFRYVVGGTAGEIGQAVFVAVPLLVAAGFIDRSIVLGTLAPGRYAGYLPRDQRHFYSVREATDEVSRAVKAGNDKGYDQHLRKALVLGNLETVDADWVDIRQRFLAYVYYIRADAPGWSNDEALRLQEGFFQAFLRMRHARRVWFGRWGKPTTPAQGATRG